MSALTSLHRILAVDPALRATGFAVLEQRGIKEQPHPLIYGVLRHPPKKSLSAALLGTYQSLLELVEEYRPQQLALEQIIYVQSYGTAITMGSARGVVLLLGAQKGLSLHEYAPRRVKQAIVGKGAASKAQVAFMVRALLGLRETPPSDAADALAIGLTHWRAQLGGCP